MYLGSYPSFPSESSFCPCFPSPSCPMLLVHSLGVEWWIGHAQVAVPFGPSSAVSTFSVWAESKAGHCSWCHWEAGASAMSCWAELGVASQVETKPGTEVATLKGKAKFLWFHRGKLVDKSNTTEAVNSIGSPSWTLYELSDFGDILRSVFSSVQ